MSEMLERVAIAIDAAERAWWSCGPEPETSLPDTLARAAIEALRHPTNEMLEAIDCAGDKQHWPSGRAWIIGYTAMIEAALR